MVIEAKRILPDTCLSKFRIRDMRIDEAITASCENAAEFTAARKTAQNAKAEGNRLDGYEYRVQSNSKENTVTVSLYKPEEGAKG